MYLIDLSYRKNTIFENHFGKEGFYGEKKKLLKKDFQENILFLSFCYFGKWDFYEMDLLGFFSRKTKIWNSFWKLKGSFMVILGKKYEVYFQGDEKFHGLLKNGCQL